jgi:hypothetical protein
MINQQGDSRIHGAVRLPIGVRGDGQKEEESSPAGPQSQLLTWTSMLWTLVLNNMN